MNSPYGFIRWSAQWDSGRRSFTGDKGNEGMAIITRDNNGKERY